MKRKFLVPALLVAVTSVLAAHDLFLTLADYRVAVGKDAAIVALNGTFSTSENSIDRVRIADLSLVTPSGRERLDTGMVTKDGPRTRIRVHPAAAGTYAAGMSLRPSEITLEGKQFNDYLTEEGLTRVLTARQKAGESAKKSKERYAKHVKILFQAGDTPSEGWSTVLGYPAEIVPLANPYTLHRGDTLKVRILSNGKPFPAGQEVLAGGRTMAGARLPVQKLVTNSEGIASVVLRSAGVWYVKFIDMTRATEPGLDYISQWATLTFALAPRKG